LNTTVTNASGNLGRLVLAASGASSYTVANSAVQYLKTGETKVDNFTITSVDGTTKTVSFTINGVNEAPTNLSSTSTSVVENVPANQVLGGSPAALPILAAVSPTVWCPEQAVRTMLLSPLWAINLHS